MIVTEDLSKEFDDFIAVDGVTFSVSAGEVLALLGPNGSGKTTTVRMLTSILLPTRGWARVAGYDVVKQAAQVRASVGVLTEHHGFYIRMTAYDYLDFFGQLYGIDLPTRRKRAESMLEEFNLAQFKNRRIGLFSRGMQQKLALARTLLHEPSVLLLDEPTSAMDPESAQLVREAIQALRSSDRTIILCTHNLSEAERLADKIAIIRSGKILAQGTPEALKQRLLGPAEYEIRLGYPQDLGNIRLPKDLQVCSTGENWLRFQPPHPEIDNPLVLQSLLNQGLAVVSLEEVPRSLEEIYLQVINEMDALEVDVSYVG
jgi:ABC-2 type transport system ATP-binding protein